jgi:2-hydroxychromene-2-carboxylate isomerase
MSFVRKGLKREMERRTLYLWLEFGSTYSHISVQRIQALSKSFDVDIAFRPFLLGPIFGAQGWNDSPFNIYPAKGEYMWKDMERRCEKYSIAFNKPSQMPRNGVLAARVAQIADGQEWQADFIRNVYNSNFVADQDISDREVLKSVLANVGCENPEQVLEDSLSKKNKLLLRERNAEALTHGIFGAPSFVANGEMFWGDDRLEDALEHLVKQE